MDKRKVCIKIMEIMEEWNEDNGFETSAQMDNEIATIIFDEAVLPNVKSMDTDSETRVEELEIVVKKLGDTVDDTIKNHIIIQPYLSIWKEHGKIIEECREV